MKTPWVITIVTLFISFSGLSSGPDLLEVQNRFFWVQNPEARQILYVDLLRDEPIALEGPDTSGNWSLRLEIPFGKHLYAYLIDGSHQPDPRIPLREFYHGKEWSVAYVGVQPPRETFQRGDGVIHPQYIQHDPQNRRHLNPVNPQEFFIGLHTRRDDVQEVILICTMAGGKEIHIPTDRIEEPNRDYYRAHWRIEDPSQWSDGFDYRFAVRDAETIIETESRYFDPKAPAVPFFDIPDWSKGRVVYQIFPERFRNGQPLNDPPFTRPWDHRLSPGNFDFYGGDLAGTMEGLDYLEMLGIDVIYLNPIFKAPSNHKYDTIDYFQIDPHFGDEKTFSDLVRMCRAMDIHLILDGVFNHSGVGFFAMQDIFLHQQDSIYLDWYLIKEFPVVESSRSYESWQNYASLPKLNHANPDVQRYVMEVVTHWSSRGISGWRLDAPTTTPRFFWRVLREHVKTLDSALLLVGEVWSDASAYFEGDTFDSTMNYLFRDAALRFIARSGQAQAFVEMTDRYLNQYPPQVIHGLWNLLGSHDTRRILNECGGDVERVKLLMSLMLSFPGSPMIYYGDEIGLPGENDPDCRRPFPWDEQYWDLDLLEHVQRWIALRHTYPALQKGGYRVLLADGGVLVFQRYLQGFSTVVIGINRTAEDVYFDQAGMSMWIPSMGSQYRIID